MSLIQQEEEAREKAHVALQRAAMMAPHLAGLAALVRIGVDRRVPTACIFASGRLLVNPRWFAALSQPDAVFVAAHELMHLALRSHDRQDSKNHLLFNIAHDYIINHMLSREFGMKAPAGGLNYPLGEPPSAETLVRWLEQNPGAQTLAFRGAPDGALARALARSGLTPENAQGPSSTPGEADVGTDALEQSLFPELTAARQRREQAAVSQEAARAAGLQTIAEAIGGRSSQGAADAVVTALQSAYRPRWEDVVQRWLEAVAPGPRTWSRASRRMGDRGDVELPGRAREGWVLHLVLDTSGSMTELLPHALGAIAAFCEPANVSVARVLQCDDRVTVDETVTLDELRRYSISGFGGSDMTPAFDRLSEDGAVEAVVVLTDGYIDYPAGTPPFAVLWAVLHDDGDFDEDFDPPYGRVVHFAAADV